MSAKPEVEAKPYHLIASENHLHDLRERAMVHLGTTLRSRSWTQEDAARYLGVAQPRVSDIMTGKTQKFSLDKILEMLFALDVPLQVDFGSVEPYERNGRWSGDDGCHDAVAFYSSVIEADPSDSVAWSRRAMAFWKLDDLESARRDFTRSMELDPNRSGARSNRVVINRSMGNFEAALEDIKILQDQFPDQSFEANLALVLEDLERYEEALGASARAIEHSPTRPGPRWNRAQLLEKLGRKAEALSDYQTVLHVDPTYPRVKEAIARVEGEPS